MRLLSPDTCPSNATRDSCPCVKDNSPRVGMSVWTKINLNITSLSINRKTVEMRDFRMLLLFSAYDFSFARQIHGAVVPYGEAGDCYSLANCPQGEGPR